MPAALTKGPWNRVVPPPRGEMSVHSCAPDAPRVAADLWGQVRQGPKDTELEPKGEHRVLSLGSWPTALSSLPRGDVRGPSTAAWWE